MSADFLLQLPSEWAREFRDLWKLLRIADGIGSEFDLVEEDRVEKFDGASFSSWIVPVTSAIAPIVTAILGYLAARKGEVEIRKGENVFKFRNLTPSQIQKVVQTITDVIREP